MRSWFRFLLCATAVALVSLSPARAHAEACRAVEVRFLPQGLPPAGGREALSPQIAVWVEDPSGRFVADVYVTRLVGLLGLGNRPGQARLKSDFRWPYGRRTMALPVWAHRRGKRYGYIVMGGYCSTKYNPQDPRDTTCPNDFTGDPSDDDRTVAYHGPVSSDEPFYCSPSGWRLQKEGGVDVISCASSFYGSKGFYAPGLTSVYPPRADLTTFGMGDHKDARRFAQDNDVAAISAATPPSGVLLDPPIRWIPPPGTPEGDYVIKVEVNIEADWNPFFGPGKAVDEPHKEWNHLGKQFLGQPSIVYSVPFRLDGSGRVATTADYEGYGDWTGESGTLNPPDMTISQSGGSGADRLRLVSDENGTWRVKVLSRPCSELPCGPPEAPQHIDLSEKTDTTLTVKFRTPGGEPIFSYQVRYQLATPITEAGFVRAMPVTSPTLGTPGQEVSTRILGLSPQSKYYVAVRSVNRCGDASPMTQAEALTQAGRFATLSGCFIATAAFGSELEAEVVALRRFRDEVLLGSPIGQLFVAGYYAMSPAFASVIRDDDLLRGAARRALLPLIRLVTRR